jgi:hypothetical protein
MNFADVFWFLVKNENIFICGSNVPIAGYFGGPGHALFPARMSPPTPFHLATQRYIFQQHNFFRFSYKNKPPRGGQIFKRACAEAGCGWLPSSLAVLGMVQALVRQVVNEHHLIVKDNLLPEP